MLRPVSGRYWFWCTFATGTFAADQPLHDSTSTKVAAKSNSSLKLCKPTQPFFATPWLFNGHLQTIFGAVLNIISSKIHYNWQIITVSPPSERFFPRKLAIDSLPRASPSPVLILLPGLTGDSQSADIQTFARFFTVNYRCSGGVELLNCQLSCGAYAEDFRQAVAFIQQQNEGGICLRVDSFSGRSPCKVYCRRERSSCFQICSSIWFSS